LQVWDTVTGEELLNLEGHNNVVGGGVKRDNTGEGGGGLPVVERGGGRAALVE
jgi:hypothetical protein